MYNYADDNTISFIHCDLKLLKQVLEQETLLLIKWFENNFMQANPDKFQAICIGKNTFENIESFQINNSEIKCEPNVNLLGVNIDFMLNFNNHISDICKKASRQLAVLKRIGKFLTKEGKTNIFNSFIISNFNYCPIVWHFCSQASSNKMEKIQERALRFINDDFESSLQDLLLANNRNFLHIGRIKVIATEVFKILNNISPSYVQDLVSLKISNYHFRKENLLTVPRVRSTRYGQRSFRFEAARIWNSLPNDIRVADSYPLFRRLLHSWSGNICQCPLCTS